MIMRVRSQPARCIVRRRSDPRSERATVPIRVVTIEDDPQYRSSLELLFRHAGDFELVESFGSPAAALARLDGGPASDGPADAPAWELVLMDVDLPGMDGIACTRRIKNQLPGTAVVVLTVFEERATIVEAICAGADGYLLKRTPAAELLTQLRAIAVGGAPISAGVARTVLDLVRHLGPVRGADGDGATRFELTERELEVLRCLVQGRSYKRTAQQLDISIDTVRSHVRSVYSKLQVHSVAEAVSRALREGIV
jgi:DNA-binding NarL/FixJ family response regulator